MNSVGDCWVGVGDEAHAHDFYHAVVGSFAGAECNKEGVSCDLIAAEELRRLSCGFAWLAPDPQTVWADVAAAVKSPATAVGVSVHLEPDVRASVTGDDARSDGCPPGAFDVPKTFSKEADHIVELSQDPKTSPLARVIVLKIADEDKPWKNRSADIYKFFHLRVCRYAGPVPSRIPARYYLALDLIAEEGEDPSCPGR